MNSIRNIVKRIGFLGVTFLGIYSSVCSGMESEKTEGLLRRSLIFNFDKNKTETRFIRSMCLNVDASHCRKIFLGYSNGTVNEIVQFFTSGPKELMEKQLKQDKELENYTEVIEKCTKELEKRTAENPKKIEDRKKFWEDQKQCWIDFYDLWGEKMSLWRKKMLPSNFLKDEELKNVTSIDKNYTMNPLVVFAGNDKIVACRLREKDKPFEITTNHRSAVVFLRLAELEDKFVFGSLDGKIRTVTLNETKAPKIETKDADFLSFPACSSLDCKIIVTAGETNKTAAEIWQLENEKFELKKTLKGHRFNVRAVCLSYDEKYIVSRDYNDSDDSDKTNGQNMGETIIIWNVESGDIEHTFEIEKHSKDAYGLCISRDNRYIFSGAGIEYDKDRKSFCSCLETWGTPKKIWNKNIIKQHEDSRKDAEEFGLKLNKFPEQQKRFLSSKNWKEQMKIREEVEKKCEKEEAERRKRARAREEN
jgi:WD40 repeat protein